MSIDIYSLIIAIPVVVGTHVFFTMTGISRLACNPRFSSTRACLTILISANNSSFCGVICFCVSGGNSAKPLLYRDIACSYLVINLSN